MKPAATPFLVVVAGLGCLAQSPAAQSSGSATAFEVASVKPSRPGTRFNDILDPAQLRFSANSLLILILSAYPDISASRLTGGPAWLNTEYWDVVAKLPPNMPTGQKELNREAEQMLQAFLADRFQLVAHREKRDQQIYGLVLSKGGPKLKPSSASQLSAKARDGKLEFQHQSMQGLVSYLYSPYVQAGVQQAADRPVIDMTGLQGYFDFTLEWTPDTSQPDQTVTGPSLFTGLEEQLGLKLQPQKSVVDFLVIDYAERPAEANQ